MQNRQFEARFSDSTTVCILLYIVSKVFERTYLKVYRSKVDSSKHGSRELMHTIRRENYAYYSKRELCILLCIVLQHGENYLKVCILL